jgi:amino acid adenylation domain-containing protein
VTTLIQEYLTRQAAARPDAVALVMDGERLTYGALEAESNRMARLLAESGCERGDRVCLLLPKAPRTIIGMLAALKADCTYVPIDVASPAARVEKIVRAADPRVVLVDSSTTGLMDDLTALGVSGVRIGTVEEGSISGRRFETSFSSSDWGPLPDAPLVSRNRSEDPAHLLFTSGSTGTPKGVVITHANVIAFVEWATAYFGTSAEDRISGHPPLHFDLSTFDIYGTFKAGAQLHLVPASVNIAAKKLAELIRTCELTQWFSVPSVMTFMTTFDVVRQDDFPALRRVIWCGEVLPTPILCHWMDRLPHATFTNLYGPTEATIASSYYTVPERPETETEPIPIGTACDGEELLVLDAELHPCPPDEIGDLYISGVGLSPGYWRDEEKTAAAFVADPRSGEPGDRIYRTGDLARRGEDGLVYFVGRADSQIKSRGYRIELGEIEAALNALGTVRECAVVGVETGGFEGTTICCAYSSNGRAVEPSHVRAALRSVLPGYMLPARWAVMDVLPKNVNGKIDRRAIRELFEGGQDGLGSPRATATAVSGP